MADNSLLAVTTNIVASPSDAFTAIKDRPRAWWPLLVIIVGYCVVSMLYMNSVDLPWFMDRQVQNAGADMTVEQREQAVEAALKLSPMVYGAIGAVSTSVFILLWLAVLSLYYTIVSFATNDGIKYKQWFGLLTWCALPLVLGLLATLANLLAKDARFLPQEALNPLAFGNLFSIETESPTILQRIVLGLDITALWSLVLTVLGYQAWTKRTIVFATSVVLGPLLAIVAISAAFAFT